MFWGLERRRSGRGLRRQDARGTEAGGPSFPSFDTETGSDCKFVNMFDEFDIDKNGTLDKAEIKTALGKLGLPNGTDAVNKLFDKFDVDRSGTISREEYAELANQVAYDVYFLPRTMGTVICSCEKCMMGRLSLEREGGALGC